MGGTPVIAATTGGGTAQHFSAAAVDAVVFGCEQGGCARTATALQRRRTDDKKAATFTQRVEDVKALLVEEDKLPRAFQLRPFGADVAHSNRKRSKSERHSR